MEKKTVAVKAFVSEDVRNLFKAVCARKGTSMSDALTALIEEFIEENEKEQRGSTRSPEQERAEAAN